MTSLLGVLVGSAVTRLIPPHVIKIGAGILFMVLGAWMVFLSGGGK